MIERKNIVIFILFSAALFINCQAESCTKQNSCLCQINDDTKIDISTLFNGHTHKYLQDFQVNSTTYYFSGCEDQTFNFTVEKVNKTDENVTVTASLFVADGTNQTTVLGKASQIHFNKNVENNYEIVYSNKSAITAKIELICGDFKVPFLKTIDSKTKVFALVSRQACLIVEHHGMSGGSKFLLVLIITLSIYFIGGGLVLYLIRGARGVEMIPNIDFWKNLPGLVKDGVIFLLSGCRPTLITSAETYDRI